MYLLFNIIFTMLVISLFIGVVSIIISAQKEKPVDLPKITFKRKKKKDKK